jgi:hypothetical protein
MMCPAKEILLNLELLKKINFFIVYSHSLGLHTVYCGKLYTLKSAFQDVKYNPIQKFVQILSL